MKKTVSFLLSLMVCLSFGAMATACGIDGFQTGSSSTQSEESGNTANSSDSGEIGGSEDENSSNSDTENDKDNSGKNEKTGLTKEEWDEVIANTIASDNFTASLARSMVYENGETWNDTLFFKSTQTAVEMIERGETRYFFMDGGKEYYYALQDGEWVKNVCGQGYSLFGKVMEDALQIPLFAMMYDQLTYDAGNDCYTGVDVVIEDGESEHFLDEVAIKIQDGKLVCAEMTMLNVASGGPSGERGSGVAVISISDYNQTEVTLPVINEKTGLTKEEWNEVAANTIASDNFTAIVEQNVVYENGETWHNTINVKSTQTAVEMIERGETYYYVIEDGQEYCYYLEDGEWVKNVNNGRLCVGKIMEEQMGIPLMIAMYDQLTYNADNDCYTGVNVVYYDDGAEFLVEEIIAKIQNKKVVYVKTKFEDNGIHTAEAYISDYDQTVVTLPVMNEKTGLTKEEWDEVFANTIASDNFTAKMETNYEYCGEIWSDVQVFKSTTNAVEIVENGETKYFSIEDGKEYCYYLEDGVWKKRLVFDDSRVWEIMENYLAIDVFATIYDQLTYDAENDCYTGANFALSREGEWNFLVEEVTIKTQDGKVVYIECTLAQDGGVAMQVLSISNYNQTEVKLPQISVD